MTWQPLAALVLLCAGVQAGAQALPPALRACTRVSDDGERLHCFDREMQALSRAADAKTPAPSAAAPRTATVDPAPAVSALPADTFGHPAPVAPQVKRLEAHIVSVSQSGSHPRFVLDNGQIWQQAEIDDTFQAKAGDPVVLSKGMLGSYFMSAGTHPAVRVSRVK